MSQRAEEILSRLSRWEAEVESDLGLTENLAAIVADARAYLARERGPVAEGRVNIHKRMDIHGQGIWHGEWTLGACYQANRPESVKVRIPVPRHLYAPEVLEGEVAEGEAR